MPETIAFKIDGREFLVSSRDLDASAFTVKSTPRPYDVEWTPDFHSVADAISASMNEDGANFLLVDENVFNLYFKSMPIPRKQMFLMSAVETKKNLNTVCKVIDAFEKCAPSKNNVLHVVGGGITQDIGAFAACIYKRGLPWRFYPTTLLSMCDSCIGGKTGINYKDGKNQLALFSAPRKVVICSEFLKTLHAREIRSGYGEILKLLITGGENFVDLYRGAVCRETGMPDLSAIKKLVFGALMVKRAVVEVDEFELNARRSLNYGHTIGHALEVLSGYRIPHGQAVALGLMIVNRMAVRRGILPIAEYKAINDLAKPLLSASDLDAISYAGLGNLLQRDKKTLTGNFVFVFIRTAGDTVFEAYPKNSETISEIESTIDEIIGEVRRR